MYTGYYVPGSRSAYWLLYYTHCYIIVVVTVHTMAHLLLPRRPRLMVLTLLNPTTTLMLTHQLPAICSQSLPTSLPHRPPTPPSHTTPLHPPPTLLLPAILVPPEAT